ncbi:DNA primase [Aphelenchoides avenae]|nr:DNA primase [Aphelenchus avenae]
MPQQTLDKFLVRTPRESPQQPLERRFVEKQINNLPMDIEAALGQHFLVFPCQADAFVRQKERGNGARVFTFESPKFRPGTSHAASPGYDPYLGSRKFLATSVQKFWHWYKQCSVPRHFYELIKEGTPCRPYFDLEYYRKFNEHLDAHETLFAFLRLCRAVFADELGVMLTDRSFLLLDSSTDAKFSVHVTVHLPDGKLFTNNVILKALIDRICARMTEEGVGIVRTEGKDAFLCDTGVYSKNRNFRLYLSSKCGKEAALRLANYGNFHGGETAQEWRVFLDSLVVPYEYEKCAVLDTSALVAALPRNPLRWVTNNEQFSLEAYHKHHKLKMAALVNCRFCFNIERQHKSQNVYWLVDLERFSYFQKCFDNDCRNYASNRFLLPTNVVNAVKSRVVNVFASFKRKPADASVE